ncbi:MAG: hypothetical protein QOF61_3216 [Acidobacteriota bacterium]|nr:hypothetical protein [Acidobacteriota bacterium]
MNVYAYCLSDEIAADALGAVTGVGGATTRLLWRDGVAAVVSDFDGDAVAVTRENVLAHERVVGAMLARATPLPFRFGTVMGEERLMSYVAAQSEALKAQLERVRGCVEMSVKVIWKAEAVGVESSPEHAAESAGSAESGAGTAFLLAKRREIFGEEAKAVRAKEITEWLAGWLAGAVRDARVEVNPHGAMVVSAAYLVERGQLAEYRERLRLAREERRDLHFLTSGAWSPYSFTSARA